MVKLQFSRRYDTGLFYQCSRDVSTNRFSQQSFFFVRFWTKSFSFVAFVYLHLPDLIIFVRIRESFVIRYTRIVSSWSEDFIDKTDITNSGRLSKQFDKNQFYWKEFKKKYGRWNRKYLSNWKYRWLSEHQKHPVTLFWTVWKYQERGEKTKIMMQKSNNHSLKK